ncbi:Vacuolar import/degradation [Abeliophyllum distichum]|uniref:Vacuolar import/degradation n=1 Tax=Abeliophyllum distichum TaxID=126358 RepID=A0ABD1SYU6_9LAMI
MPSSLDEVESRLKALKIKYNNQAQNNYPKNFVKLYFYVTRPNLNGLFLKKSLLTLLSKRHQRMMKRRKKMKISIRILVKFFSAEEYEIFVGKYQGCLFENTYGYEANDENRVKVYRKGFMGWAKPEEADDSMWEDAEESFFKTPTKTPVKVSHDLNEEFEEAAANGGAIRSLALGALDNIFLVSD